MRFAILGTGALARLYAGLFRSLHPTLIGRHGGAFVLADAGLEEILDPPFLTWQKASGQPWDVVLIAVKWPAMPTLRIFLEQIAGDALVISLMNGMGQEEALIPPLDPAQLACGMTTDAVTAYWDEAQSLPGARVTAHGDTLVPLMPHPYAPLWQETVTQLALPWKFVRQELVVHYRWIKLVQNSLINPLTALANVSNGAVLDLPLWGVAAALLDEATKVAHAAGQSLGDNLMSKVTDLAKATATNRSSMVQDVQRHRATEIDAINGYIIAQGQRLGIPAPTHQAVANLIHAFPIT